jgi:hypothetical protein
MSILQSFSSFVLPLPKVCIISSWPQSLHTTNLFFFAETSILLPISNETPYKDSGSLLQLVDSDLTLTTHEMIRDITVLAITASDYETVLNRFKVQSITHCKDYKKMPHHEVLIIRLIDTNVPTVSGSSNPRSSLLVLERTSSDVRSIKEACPLMSSLSRSRERLGYQPVGDTDLLSITSSACASTHSLSSTYLATNTFTGGGNVKSYADSIRIIRQIEPSNLSFFELAVLADSIHIHQPNYSAMSTQCFWFAGTVCEIVEQEYMCFKTITGLSSSSSSSGGSVGDSSTPRSDYLPNLSGRVKGILISGPNEPQNMLDLVDNFKGRLVKKREEVSITNVHPECYILKPRYR